MKELSEKYLDSQLWHACAGGMVQIPQVGAKVFYFPQGHAEHTLTDVDFSTLPKIPPLILCRVVAVKFLADVETDEVYARIKLVPILNDPDLNDDVPLESNDSEAAEKPNSFAKTLTQSDANNGGGFSVPRYCAETIFPPLDYSADPPVQTLTVKDVHGSTWKFRHIYRGTPRRHLLTTGWSTFVNQKKLIAGDSIVFLRSTSGDIFVGIRRVKKPSIVVPENSSMWSSIAGNPSSVGSGFRDRGRVNPQAVLEAAYLAANGKLFEVVYYPRTSTPEFCVKASSVSSAMTIQWCPKMRFKMAFETEDSSRISWFLGTVSSVRVTDPIHWPNSPWRLLQVTWDEPDLLQNVKHVSPWMIELVASMPLIHMAPFSPPRKKLCLSLDGHLQIPSFSGNTLGASTTFYCAPDNISAGIQGARHSHSGHPLMDFQLNNKLHLGLSPPSKDQTDNSENISCLLTAGPSTPQKLNKTDNSMTPQFLLFGQPILTEQQLSHRTCLENQTLSTAELSIVAGHCKVFLGTEGVARNLDLSVIDSYEDLYKKLANMFGIECSAILNHLIYSDATGAVKQVGDDLFSVFKSKANRLTILVDSGSSSERMQIDGVPTSQSGLDSSNQAGFLGISA